MTLLSTRVYALLRTVPKGRVTTYKALAEGVGTHAYQAIGQILHHNPYAPIVPCHRVVSSNGTIGGFNGHRSGKTIMRKIALLKKEGVCVRNNTIVDFPNKLYIFNVQ